MEVEIALKGTFRDVRDFTFHALMALCHMEVENAVPEKLGTLLFVSHWPWATRK